MSKTIFIQGAICAGFIAEQIEKHKHKTDIGAHEIFLGQVRADKINDEQVQCIEYSAYEDMANILMADYREKLFQKYNLSCMHVYHSLGSVACGEICFFVFVSSAHRQDARHACAELVDWIKKEVPIWGKEICEEQSHWKTNK